MTLLLALPPQRHDLLTFRGLPQLQAWLGAPVSRISPLLNAVDIDQYPISTAPRPPRPTTVMLSHVYPLKDIVSAIRAAAIIVHTYHVAGVTCFNHCHASVPGCQVCCRIVSHDLAWYIRSQWPKGSSAVSTSYHRLYCVHLHTDWMHSSDVSKCFLPPLQTTTCWCMGR